METVASGHGEGIVKTHNRLSLRFFKPLQVQLEISFMMPMAARNIRSNHIPLTQSHHTGDAERGDRALCPCLNDPKHIISYALTRD